MLTPFKGAEKSYGILGFGQSTDGSAQKLSFVETQAEMVTGTETTKYLAVSVWANSWGADSNSKTIEIEFYKRSWATYKTDWEKPTEPTAALSPDIPYLVAKSVWLQTGIGAALGLYGYLA